MNKGTVGLGLIGCGNMGNYYTYNISRIPHVQIESCCDPTPSKLRTFCEKWNIADGYTDWQQLISSNPDGIINCALDALHSDVFFACIDNNIPLLMEKPPALPLSLFKTYELDTLRNHTFVINFSKRYLPVVKAVKALIKDGGLGKLQHLEFHYRQGWIWNHDFGDWHEDSSWFWRLSNALSFYGVLGDLGSHLLDMAVHLGGWVEDIECRMHTFQKDKEVKKGKKIDSPDDAICMLNFENGASGIVNTSRAVPGERDQVDVIVSGREASVKFSLESAKDRYELFTTRDDKWQTIDCPQKYKRNYEHFIDVLQNGALGDIPGLAEAICNQLLLEAAVASDTCKCEIKLSEFLKEKMGAEWIWIRENL